MLFLPQVSRTFLPAPPLFESAGAAEPNSVGASGVRPEGDTGGGRTPPRVLMVGEDATLQYTRQLLLEYSGYEVVATSAQELLVNRQMTGCDLILLCHSVCRERSARLAALAREICPDTPVLLIRGFGRSAQACSETLLVPAAPGALLRVMGQHLARHGPVVDQSWYSG